MQDLCIEKYKTLPRITEKDLGKGKLLLLLIANKMSILINYMAILLWPMGSIQSPPKSKRLLSLELASWILQSLGNCKGLQIAKNSIAKEHIWSSFPSKLQTLLQSQHKHRCVDKWNRNKGLEIIQLIVFATRMPRPFKGERTAFQHIIN